MGIDSKLSAYYVVPDNYLFVEKNAIEKLGSCFIEQSYYNRIERNYEKTKSWNKEEFYLGFFAFNGYFYYNLKGCSTMEYGTIRSFNAAEETINLLRKNKTNVRNINPVSNYYLYHWLFTSGEYVWSTRNECFVRNDDYLNKEEVQELNREINITGDNISLGRTASSWGLSIDSLSKIFSAPGLEYSCTADQTKALVNFKEMIDGDEADFVYLEFCGMDQNYDYILFDHIADEVLDEGPIGNLLLKKDYNRGMTVVVSWEDEKGDTHTMNCLMGQGKLLIPLGGGSCWLLHKQKGLTLSVFQNDVPIPLPEINKICFLKLREVQ